MTTWFPDLSERSTAIYLAIADALAADVDSGVLPPGTRLPAQRDLAHELGLTVTTVTRGYAEAQRRGLISSHVGRGTFVTQPEVALRDLREDTAIIDLSMNSLMPYAHVDLVTAHLWPERSRAETFALLGYQPFAGGRHHREAGAAWIGRAGLEVSSDQVLVTAGAQHAMEVVFSTLLSPGDVVVTEALTYSGLKSLANHLHFRLEGLEMDEHGMLPAAFERACDAQKPKMLYCLPTAQNPTGSVMPVARRRQIAAIARDRGVSVVEDGSYGFYVPDDVPLASFAPERSYYITATSKSLVPALRVGYLATPPGLTPRFVPSIFASTVMASPLTAEIATAWMADGLADRIVQWKRKEIAARRELARRLLGGHSVEGHALSPHLFVRLPEPWRAEDFAAQARLRGVAVNTAQEFAVGRAPAPHAIRICLGCSASRDELSGALTTITEMLRSQPEPSTPVV